MSDILNRQQRMQLLEALDRDQPVGERAQRIFDLSQELSRKTFDLLNTGQRTMEDCLNLIEHIKRLRQQLTDIVE